LHHASLKNGRNNTDPRGCKLRDGRSYVPKVGFSMEQQHIHLIDLLETRGANLNDPRKNSMHLPASRVNFLPTPAREQDQNSKPEMHSKALVLHADLDY